MADSRHGATNVWDEPGQSCHTAKKLPKTIRVGQRIQEPTWKDSYWPKIEQCDHQ